MAQAIGKPEILCLQKTNVVAFSAEEKVRILREHLLEHALVSDLCENDEIKLSQYLQLAE